jgi:GNAT superfamily N-acetyltransferase
LDPPPGITMGAVDDIHSIAPAGSAFQPRSSYAGFDSSGFALFKNGELACLCWFWGSRRFHDPLLWKLHDGEAILVDLLTAPEFRGQGLAPLLINYASIQMIQRGYSPLYTWMWLTHRASSRSFEKAGWKQVATVAELYPLNLGRAIRFQRLPP